MIAKAIFLCSINKNLILNDIKDIIADHLANTDLYIQIKGTSGKIGVTSFFFFFIFYSFSFALGSEISWTIDKTCVKWTIELIHKVMYPTAVRLNISTYGRTM